MAAYKATVDRVIKWLHEVLVGLLSRRTPFLGTDLNDGLGLTSDGVCTGKPCGPVGEAEPDIEHYAGMKFRELLKLHHLTAFKTHGNAGHTYFSADSGSPIEYCCTSDGLLFGVLGCGVLIGAGKRLQMIAVKGPRDHWPLLLNISEVRPNYEMQSKRGGEFDTVRWNQ